jgi:hypothetical protein
MVAIPVTAAGVWAIMRATLPEPILVALAVATTLADTVTRAIASARFPNRCAKRGEEDGSGSLAHRFFLRQLKMKRVVEVLRLHARMTTIVARTLATALEAVAPIVAVLWAAQMLAGIAEVALLAKARHANTDAVLAAVLRACLLLTIVAAISVIAAALTEFFIARTIDTTA